MEIKKPTDNELQDFLLRKFLEEKINQDAKKEADAWADKYKQRLMKVTPQVLYNFLRDRGISAFCASCGAAELSVPESSSAQFEMLKSEASIEQSTFGSTHNASFPTVLKSSYVSYTTLDGQDNLRYLRGTYYPVHCLRCGHLSLYRTATVLNWLELLEKKGEKE